MIMHVAMFQFKHELKKMANMVKAKDMLEALPGKVEWLNTIEVGIDFNRGAKSYDFCVYSTFHTKQDLMWFTSAPAHLEVIRFLQDITTAMHVVDYEVDNDGCSI